ncbi:glycosyltransferase, partial [Streptomyces sp. NPDC002920]
VRSAEVACVPSLYEGFSLPAAEAMATGTPLLATTGGAIPEVAGRDGETCLAVPPGDAGALAAGLGRLLGDPGLRARLGAAGRERVLQRFTWARAAEGTVARYREAMATAGGGRRSVPAARDDVHVATERDVTGHDVTDRGDLDRGDFDRGATGHGATDRDGAGRDGAGQDVTDHDATDRESRATC